MAFSSGVFSLVSGNPVVTGTTISSTWANNTLSDVATNGLSICVLKDGSQTITADLPMATHKLTGLSAGAANGDSIRYEQTLTGLATAKGDLLLATAAHTVARQGVGSNAQALLADSSQTNGVLYALSGAIPLTAVAGTNTITATVAPIPSAYATGQSYYFIPANTNTGATTLNPSAMGAKNVFAFGAACLGGELVAGVPALVFYDGTQFNLLNSQLISTTGTAVATTSGTTADFTGIPANVRRITVNLNGVSTNGVSALLVQIGPSAGIVSTGYVSGCTNISAYGSSTAGFVITRAVGAADAISGIVTLSLESAANNTWTGSSLLNLSSSAAIHMGAGVISLAGALSKIRLTSVSADTFDAGEVNIQYGF